MRDGSAKGLPHPKVSYDDDKFQISLDCKHYKPEELDVKVDGHTIIITATQQVKIRFPYRGIGGKCAALCFSTLATVTDLNRCQFAADFKLNPATQATSADHGVFPIS